MLGKLFGALIGSSFGLFGVIMGILLGHVFDTMVSTSTARARLNPDLDEDGLAAGLFTLFGAFTAFSGGPTNHQVMYLNQILNRVMNLGMWDAQSATSAFNNAAENGPSPTDVARQLSARFILDRTTAVWVWTVCKELIRMGRGDESAYVELENVAEIFGFTVRRRTGFAGASRVAPARQDDFALLGVTPDADNTKIKAAFRKLARENHPDTLNHLDEDGEERKRRAEHFLKIQSAYERLRSQRGF